MRTPVGPEESYTAYRLLLMSVLAALIGLAGGVLAFVLLRLIGLAENLVFFGRVAWSLPPVQLNHLGLWVLIVPALGGLVVGLMAQYGTPKIRGHGIPEAMEAVLINKSSIDPKVDVYKPLATAIAIGTGGPFGAEGPIIQTGGAVGSLLGQLVSVTAAERKVLLACGAAAGMAATFNTPLAGVVLAIELLLFEFKSRSFIPLVIASTVATSLSAALFHRGPLFHVTSVHFGLPQAMPAYLLLGLICGLAAVGFTRLLFWAEDRFESIRISPILLPAIGGLGLGVIAYFVPRVLGVGYDTINAILNGSLPLTLLVAVMVAKAAALVVSLASGTSGGLLAPLFMSSAALGAVYGELVRLIFPALGADPNAFALAALGAVFGAASRASFTFIIFAFEITQDYRAVLPVMLVAVVANLVAVRWLPNSVMTEKLIRRGRRVASDYEVDIMGAAQVADVMAKDFPAAEAATPIAEVLSALRQRPHPRAGLLVLSAEQELIGVTTRKELEQAVGEGRGERPLAELAHPPVVAYPDETLRQAIFKMIAQHVGRLPVVERNAPGRPIGYLGRSEILEARRKLLEEEVQPEPGWLSLRRPSS